MSALGQNNPVRLWQGFLDFLTCATATLFGGNMKELKAALSRLKNDTDKAVKDGDLSKAARLILASRLVQSAIDYVDGI